ncbi:hypothetical protein [Chloroflexus sp.]|uniref:hypothetical protein n=1 Tax=Chloroflexus sp. TaxID=1904827 RepID=UPI00262BC3B5|nr:hypothetical protein [uncultured Chloroflexus sp.]
MSRSKPTSTGASLLDALRIPLPGLRAKQPPMIPDNRPDWQRQLQAVIEVQLARFPFLIQLRATWRLLREERHDWPWLLPLLAVIFARTYRRERQRLRQQ